ncbi:MAG: hypothetical protein KC466_08905 [Myxococcales bacterium]|nr:hypothetical protein [Myxococcales bacterium]
MKARALAVLCLAIGLGACASAPTRSYLEETAPITEGIDVLGRALAECGASLGEVESRWLASRDLDLRRRDPGEAERRRAGALEAADAAMACLDDVRTRAVDMAARARVLGREALPSVRVVHAPTGRVFSYRDYQARLEEFFAALVGFPTEQSEGADPFEEYRGEASRAEIEQGREPVLIARGPEMEPADLDALERAGALRSPYQVANYLDGLRCYLQAFRLRVEGRGAVDFYHVTPFRNVNKPWWPGTEYVPILHWEVRINRNFSLYSDGSRGRTSYLGVLDQRLGPIGARVAEIAEELALYRQAFERAAGRPKP